MNHFSRRDLFKYLPFAALTVLAACQNKPQADAKNVLQPLSAVRCIHCRYCMPCPFGIDIPGIFSFINESIEENIIPDSAATDRAKKILSAYDRAIPELRQADKCTGCNRCVALCPEDIAIPDEMLRIAKFFESLR